MRAGHGVLPGLVCCAVLCMALLCVAVICFAVLCCALLCFARALGGVPAPDSPSQTALQSHLLTTVHMALLLLLLLLFTSQQP